MVPAGSAPGSDRRALPEESGGAPRPRPARGVATALACALCAAWWAAALHGSAGAQPLPPDAAHYAGIARNLLAGRGYTVEWIEYHVGLRDGVRHVSELHGILRPLVLAPLFGLLGERDGLVRIPGTTWAALSALAAFAFARSRFGPAAGLLACLLVLGSPAPAAWAWAGTDDTGFALFFLCALWLGVEGLGPRGGPLRPRAAALAGAAAGLALLEKQTGFVLSVPLAVVWLLARRRGAGAGFAARLFLPLGAAAGAYALRNLAAHGSLAFELGPLSWITKDEGIDGFFRLYEVAPTLSGVLAELGPGRVAEIALEQLARLGAAVFLPGSASGNLHLLALGLPALVWQLRRDRDFALPALAAALASIAFLCGFYAMEARYFLMLIPLSAVSLGGALAAGLAAAGPGAARRLARGACAAAAAGIVLWAGLFSVRLAGGTALPAVDHRRLCPEAVAWLREKLPPDAVVLTHNPWWLSWVTGRPAVAIPTGGADALAKVARHYGAAWVHLAPVWGREAAVARAHRLMRGAPGLAAELALPGPRCSVYRLGAVAGSARPGAG